MWIILKRPGILSLISSNMKAPMSDIFLLKKCYWVESMPEHATSMFLLEYSPISLWFKFYKATQRRLIYEMHNAYFLQIILQCLHRMNITHVFPKLNSGNIVISAREAGKLYVTVLLFNMHF